MVLDRIINAHKYYSLHPGFRKAFEFILDENLLGLKDGRYEIDGSAYVLISRQNGKKVRDAKLEAHRKYIDIQFCISGTDNIGWKPAAECIEIKDGYNTERDIEFFLDKPESWLALPSGTFAVFFPEDAHAPLVSEDVVWKAVVKVPAEVS